MCIRDRSETEAPALAPYGYKAGDKMTHKNAGLAHWEISFEEYKKFLEPYTCLLYTSPSPRDRTRSRMPSSA